ncbi:M1 family metallopeptidase [Ginsengibacter hankyongi]|uniref:M1 family metallopeptidase n=1 Tax=Ginsengibacter hankyongi TaxID=2607284 RepID=A0A5J5IKG6_9BACT|nr:M1 family metallopeptidase [Ginsengibacter hankyongi]KAA9039187.1 M1 family metallopeptidase [Ginsengibacter hankyongi]
MKRISLVIIFNLAFVVFVSSQPNRWQQHVKYNMNVDVDVNTNRFTGVQKLEYTNNSPDKLNRVFFHLYWNAFQPGSEMDVRSRELGKILINGRPDWDSRVRDRISKLTPEEIGYQKIKSLTLNGVEQPMKVHGTILEVDLTKPILPKTKVNFQLVFEARVPLQIRRSGRDNAEGIRYSISQWYPKMCEYDYEGWHPTPYVAREFYGVWGDYDVTIKIDKAYKLAGTGILQNAASIGWGYDKPGTPLKDISSAKRTWHFIGNNVHDFVWAADPNYEHIVRKQDGVILNVVYKKVDSLEKKWQTVADAAVTVLPYMEKRFGKYPYPQYSFIQGGDGGMEYPMATLLRGPGLGGVFHEWMHSWYQMMLGTNESLYPWMDEGFTSYAEAEVTAYYDKAMNIEPSERQKALPLNHAGAYNGYYFLMKQKLEEPLTTHSDHYNTNLAYEINAYSKGEMFLEQLGYIVSDSVRDKILLEYYKLWRFKHPNASDFMKVAQDVSGVQLDCYKEYWISTTKSIDYAIDSLWGENGISKIRLRRIGQMPMPIDLQLTFKDSSREIHYIPLDLMFGDKPAEGKGPFIAHSEWNWTNPTYVVEFKHPLTDLVLVEIDPTKRMADVDQKNNTLKLNW